LTQGRAIKGAINPLQFIEVDEPWASTSKALFTPEAVLRFLCTPQMPHTVEAIVERYRSISNEKVRLNMAPAEPRLLEKLVWPLRHAKASYTLGNYLGTIALTGLVGEMVAILFFEISNFTVNKNPMTPDVQEGLFGRSFEKLGQERRVKVLSAYGIISTVLKADFDHIRAIRQKYLHLWSYDHATIQRDAIDAYHAAVALVVGVIGQEIKDGMFLLNPSLLAYLERIGFLRSSLDEGVTNADEVQADMNV
jgi:hypothetical protein